MSDTVDRAGLEQLQAAARKLAPAGESAAETWILFNNFRPGVYIQLPRAGTLSVTYEYQGGPEMAVGVVRLDAGIFVPIEPGGSSIAVEAGDYLFYLLSDCAKDVFALTYRLT